MNSECNENLIYMSFDKVSKFINKIQTVLDTSNLLLFN